MAQHHVGLQDRHYNQAAQTEDQRNPKRQKEQDRTPTENRRTRVGVGEAMDDTPGENKGRGNYRLKSLYIFMFLRRSSTIKVRISRINTLIIPAAKWPHVNVLVFGVHDLHPIEQPTVMVYIMNVEWSTLVG